MPTGKVVILAGGLGSRLSEETDLRPKPMVEIGGRPILWHIMKIYSRYGLNDFVICLGYKGYVIKEFFFNYHLHMADVTFDLRDHSTVVHRKRAEPWRVTLVETGDATMTGGRLKRAREYLGEAPFHMTYGDGVADIDLDALTACHQRNGTLATITAVQPPGRFGVLDIDAAGRVGSFREKPQAEGGWINGGFMVLSPKVLDYIADDATPFESEPLSHLARDGQLGVYRHTGFWQAMDTLRDKRHLEELWGRRHGAVEDLVKPLSDFWSGKRVLVLGHTGFKGAWLGLWLHRLGARVAGVALPPDGEPNLFAAAGLAEVIETAHADIRDHDAVMRAVERIAPEVVFHLAAQSLVRLSYREPVATYATNVMGTVHVLAAAAATESVRCVVIVTSDKCYENREWLWAYREDEPLGGHDPYSSSKACAELVTAAWRRSFCGSGAARRLGIASARAGNVFGGGDWAEDRLVPDCMRALGEGRPVGIRNPGSTRPWQHVLDPLHGYLLLAERLWQAPDEYGEAWNFGPPEDDIQPVSWLADAIVRRWGNGASWEAVAGDARHEASMLKVDAAKARARLGWSQRLPLAAGLDWTVDWYRGYLAGHGARAMTEDQIARFELLPRPAAGASPE